MSQEKTKNGRLALESGEPSVARLSGDWRIRWLGDAESDLRSADWPGSGRLVIDGSGIQRMDTAGAWLLVRLAEGLREAGVVVGFEGFGADEDRVLRLAETGLDLQLLAAAEDGRYLDLPDIVADAVQRWHARRTRRRPAGEAA